VAGNCPAEPSFVVAIHPPGLETGASLEPAWRQGGSYRPDCVEKLARLS
jgi:hypothetical protein